MNQSHWINDISLIHISFLFTIYHIESFTPPYRSYLRSTISNHLHLLLVLIYDIQPNPSSFITYIMESFTPPSYL